MKAIRSDAEDFAEAGLLKDGDTLDAVLARITGYADYASGVADVDFVIESVAENLDIKKSVWAEVEHAAPKDAILSTNTSGLSPTALQSVLKKPERFVEAHFWNPAQLMPLVEVVPGVQPSHRKQAAPQLSRKQLEHGIVALIAACRDNAHRLVEHVVPLCAVALHGAIHRRL